MLTSYCPNCGHPNHYSVSAPKFCGQCGKSMAFKVEAAKNQVERLPRVVEVQDVEDEEIEEDIDLTAFEAEKIEVIDKPVTLKDVGLQKKTGFVRPKAKKVSKKQVIAEIRELGKGSSRIEIGEENGG